MKHVRLRKFPSEVITEYLEAEDQKVAGMWRTSHSRMVSEALHDWCAKQDDASHVLYEVTQYNLRLGAWLASQVAREGLRVVPTGELRPLAEIEAAEAWVKDPSDSNRWRCARAVKVAADITHAARDNYYTNKTQVLFAAYSSARSAASCAYNAGAYMKSYADYITYKLECEYGGFRYFLDAANYSSIAASAIIAIAARTKQAQSNEEAEVAAIKNEKKRLCSVIAEAIPQAMELIAATPV